MNEFGTHISKKFALNESFLCDGVLMPEISGKISLSSGPSIVLGWMSWSPPLSSGSASSSSSTQPKC